MCFAARLAGGPGLRFNPELARRRAACREQTGHVAVLSTIDEVQRRINTLNMNQPQHRPKYFSTRNLTIR